MCDCVNPKSTTCFTASSTTSTCSTLRRCITLRAAINRCFLLLMLHTLTLAEVYKIPLKRASGLLSEAVLASEHGGMKSFYVRQEDNLHGKPGQGYYMEMQLGTPPQKLRVLVDTGSSNFAVAAAPHPDIETYFRTKQSTSFTDLGTEVYVPYTQGNWDGSLGRDLVRMSSLPNISVEANLACIASSEKFFINGSNWEGILGLAYAEIARPDSSIEPYFDSLVKQAAINDTFSMQLCGTIDTPNSTDVSMGGSLIVGGVDPSLYTGKMIYATIHKPWYYEVVITDMKVNGKSLAMDCKEYNFDKTIVDSGTTNLRLPKRVFSKLVNLIKADTKLINTSPPPGFWEGEEILCWPIGQAPWESFPMVTISLAESRNSTIDLVVSPQQYLRAVGDESVGSSGVSDCYKFAVTHSETGSVLGAVVMEGYYVVFDRANKKIGFAKSTCPNRNPSSTTPSLGGPYTTHIDNYDCAYIKPSNNPSTLITVAYVMAGICGACVIPLILMVAQWQWHRCRKPRQEVSDIGSLLKDDDESMSR